MFSVEIKEKMIIKVPQEKFKEMMDLKEGPMNGGFKDQAEMNDVWYLQIFLKSQPQ